MTETKMINQMYDTLEALPPGTTAQWLANYHFHRQDFHFTREECLTLARIAISSL
jgi:hypothetical protein